VRQCMLGFLKRKYRFTYCRKACEPRTFLRDNILEWKVLDETFVYNPLIEQWWHEEGKKSSYDRRDWEEWKSEARRRSNRGQHEMATWFGLSAFLNLILPRGSVMG